jgi:hypothetical protein
MDDLIAELKNSISDGPDGSDEFLQMSSRYSPIKIVADNFHDIRRNTLLQKNILFVDGGNSILFESAGFCLGYIRTCGILYNGNVRLSRKSAEFYILVRESGGVFNVKTFPDSDFNNLVFRSEDESLRNGLERSTPSKIIPVIRRFAELRFAKLLDNHNVDYILLDGTLEARYPYEKEYLDGLCQTAKSCSLGKTCALTTNQGVPITKRLYDMKDGEWYYHPIVENHNPAHQADIYFVKFNSRSRHVFRFEVQAGFKGDIADLFSGLATNSKDPVFLGYPYGFVDVDSHARVSEEERKSLQTYISVKLGKEWNEFSKNLNSLNAHEILDKIRY